MPQFPDPWVEAGKDKIRLHPELVTTIAALLGCYVIRCRRGAVKAKEAHEQTGDEGQANLQRYYNAVQRGLIWTIKDLTSGQFEDMVQKAYDEFGGMPGATKEARQEGQQRYYGGNRSEPRESTGGGGRRYPTGDTRRSDGVGSRHQRPGHQGGGGAPGYRAPGESELAGPADGEAPF